MSVIATCRESAAFPTKRSPSRQFSRFSTSSSAFDPKCFWVGLTHTAKTPQRNWTVAWSAKWRTVFMETLSTITLILHLPDVRCVIECKWIFGFEEEEANPWIVDLTRWLLTAPPNQPATQRFSWNSSLVGPFAFLHFSAEKGGEGRELNLRGGTAANTYTGTQRSKSVSWPSALWTFKEISFAHLRERLKLPSCDSHPCCPIPGAPHSFPIAFAFG